jgi:hypothetical protein
VATRARASAGNGRGGPRPWRRQGRALSRADAAGRGGRRRAAVPASRGPVVARRYAVSGTVLSRSARVARPTVPTILSP